jgi:hypothetical protein
VSQRRLLRLEAAKRLDMLSADTKGKPKGRTVATGIGIGQLIVFLPLWQLAVVPDPGISTVHTALHMNDEVDRHPNVKSRL